MKPKWRYNWYLDFWKSDRGEFGFTWRGSFVVYTVPDQGFSTSL